jgi:hypothetical protein
MFYILIFSLLAVVLVVGGITTMNRRRHNLATDEGETTVSADGRTIHSQVGHTTHTDADRRNRKAKRAQSRKARRKRN